MKTRNYLLSAIVLMLLSFQLKAQKVTINLQELPATAQTFLKTHFAKEPVSYILKETENLVSVEYKVLLANGTKVEFDKSGEWEEVDGKYNVLPVSFMPNMIVDYVKKSFPSANIHEIEKDYWGYEVKLSNGLEVKFDSKGNFKKIDD